MTKPSLNNPPIEYTYSLDKASRIDIYLANNKVFLTRTKSKLAIKNNFVFVNSKSIKPSYTLSDGDIIQFYKDDFEQFIKEIPLSMEPQKSDLAIIFEDDSFLVINKEHGVPVHPSKGHPDNTLVNYVLYHSQNLSEGSEPFRPGVVHRLDIKTRGLIAMAKTDLAHLELASQFKDKTAKRVYYCFVKGAFPWKHKTIESYIGRHPTNRLKMHSFDDEMSPHHKWAVTEVENLDSNLGISFLKVSLKTGRTHQIRVHLKSLGFPIILDDLYNNLPLSTQLKALKLDKMLLFAKKLGLKHPLTQESIEFSAPWPQDYLKIFDLYKFIP